jgi:hypothetical protein
MEFSGSRQFLLKPIRYSLPKIKRFETNEVFFASPKFHVHPVEVESFVFLSLKLFPSHSLPSHCSGWSKGYIMVRATHTLLVFGKLV